MTTAERIDEEIVATLDQLRESAGWMADTLMKFRHSVQDLTTAIESDAAEIPEDLVGVMSLANRADNLIMGAGIVRGLLAARKELLK